MYIHVIINISFKMDKKIPEKFSGIQKTVFGASIEAFQKFWDQFSDSLRAK